MHRSYFPIFRWPKFDAQLCWLTLDSILSVGGIEFVISILTNSIFSSYLVEVANEALFNVLKDRLRIVSLEYPRNLDKKMNKCLLNQIGKKIFVKAIENGLVEMIKCLILL